MLAHSFAIAPCFSAGYHDRMSRPTLHVASSARLDVLLVLVVNHGRTLPLASALRVSPPLLRPRLCFRPPPVSSSTGATSAHRSPHGRDSSAREPHFCCLLTGSSLPRCCSSASSSAANISSRTPCCCCCCKTTTAPPWSPRSEDDHDRASLLVPLWSSRPSSTPTLITMHDYNIKGTTTLDSGTPSTSTTRV